MGVVRVRSDERPWLCHELVVLSTWAERLRGLLGTDEGAAPVMLLRCGSVHTFGMSYPIDVAFVGERGEVLEVRRGVGPGEFLSSPGAECTIERPANRGRWVEEGEHLWVVSLSVPPAT